MRPIVPSPQEYNYRNRIRVHVEAGITGFYAHGSRALVDIAQCPISAPEVNEELQAIRKRSLPDGDYVLSARQRGRFFRADERRSFAGDARRRGEGDWGRPAGAGGRLLRRRTLCEHLRGKFTRVIGIEENAFAVDVARHGASDAESYIAGDWRCISGDPHRERSRDDDGPAGSPAIGVVPRVVDILLGSRPSELVYVSCNPATLARDLALLSSGYELKAITPLDMFPQTAEIEVVAQLSVRPKAQV